MKNAACYVGLFLLDISCKKDNCDLPKPCKEKPDLGPCDDLISKYYCDSELNTCRKFEWGGCGGNEPFETLKECKGYECTKSLGCSITYFHKQKI